MIERAYVAICDECYTEAEKFMVRHGSHRDYVDMIRGQGWRVWRKAILCPDCVADRMVTRVTRT